MLLFFPRTLKLWLILIALEIQTKASGHRSKVSYRKRSRTLLVIWISYTWFLHISIKQYNTLIRR